MRRWLNQDAAADPIQAVNCKSDTDFLTAFLPNLPREWTHPRTQVKYQIRFASARALTAAELDTCLNLVEQTSGHDYRQSSLRWHPAAKRREMRSQELRYILINAAAASDDGGDAAEGSGHDGPRQPQQQQRQIQGFASFMPTYEAGWPVVYCYEIHLGAELKGTGLGKLLMDQVIAAGENMAAVEKIMLTCFTSNVHARTFYDRLGFGVDESSPAERTLRGKVVVPDYVILSKATKRALPQQADMSATNHQ